MAPPSESGSTGNKPTPAGPERERVRRQQVIGILLVAAAVLVFTLLRANWHNLFPQGWWRW